MKIGPHPPVPLSLIGRWETSTLPWLLRRAPQLRLCALFPPSLKGRGVGGLGLFIFLILSACAPSAASITPTPSAFPTTTPTPTATIEWFPATATPTQLPTQPPPPEVDLHPGLGEVVLRDDFSDQKVWETGQFPGGSVAFGKNALTVALGGAKASVASRRSQLELRDFYLEISAEASLCRGTDNYGLLLRSASTSDFYRWVITCEGMLRVERVVGGTVAVIQDWTQSVSRPEANRLGVWVYGREMRFFINDIYQFSVSDPVLTAGGVGVFARASGQDALTVNFSDLVVRKIDPAQVAAASTPTPEPASSTAQPSPTP